MLWQMVILFVIIGVCAKYLAIRHTRIRESRHFVSPDYVSLVQQINEFHADIEVKKREYFTHRAKQRLLSEHAQLRKDLQSHQSFAEEDIESAERFMHTYDNLHEAVRAWNEEYVRRELDGNSCLFDNIDGKALDEEQRRAVVVDEDNNLVIAGAGSGKTLTISGKVKYLVDRKQIQAGEILMLSFTRKAADEMQTRISNRLNISVEAKTFHRLGLEIISSAKGYRPDVNAETYTIVDRYFRNEIVSNKDLVDRILQFYGYYLYIPLDLDAINNLGEAHDYYRHIDLETIKSKIERLKREKTTLKGERVKSYEEVVIANFLYLNGIHYEYEKLYPFPQEDKRRKRYRPDFYLGDYDVYLEHFGISRDNRTPWLSEIEERKYLDGMTWKRGFHKENGTRLIETYSYEFSEGMLFRELERKLKLEGVRFSPIDHSDLYNELLVDNNDRHFTELKKLTRTFIDLFKSRGWGREEFERMLREAEGIQNSFLRERTKLFLSIARPMFEFYESELRRAGQIDFNDMINLASDLVAQNEVQLRYKYIIVDEYQDMSVSRFRLIRSIRDGTGAKLLCVGDDWQSIYRFAGSDIDLLVNFSGYFGYTELLKIQTTYRNSQELVDIAGRFISENPKQIRKKLSSDKRMHKPVRIFGYGSDFAQAFVAAIEEIVKHKRKDNPEVMLIGRTNYDIRMFVRDEQGNSLNSRLLEEFRVVNASGQVSLVYKKYPKLRMTFLTAHAAKGLEAEYVIVINMKNELLGFPNRIADDPLLGLVLTDADPFSFAEERRLFYVALTRTRNLTFLIAPERSMSVFAEELIKKQAIRYEFATDEEQTINNPSCPRCGKGRLVIRENSLNGSTFLGCSNYPLCDNTFRHVEILDKGIRCLRCGGYMVRRSGQFGDFFGCTNYPDCRSTYDVENVHA